MMSFSITVALFFSFCFYNICSVAGNDELRTLYSDTTGTSYKNVYGKKLQPCSTDGMAMTGFTRTGYCVDKNYDKGSHHICIDMTSTTGGNFCDVTGQSDWCSSSLPCQEDTNQECSVQNWCVCQWAFASYIKKAGGCDKIQDVACESINMEALLAYRKNYFKYGDALECLEAKCGFNMNIIKIQSVAKNPWSKILVGSVVLITVAFIWRAYEIRKNKTDLSNSLMESSTKSVEGSVA